MNLGYGLAAVDSYFKAGDERKVREYDQAKRDAELSLMPDKMDADRNRIRLESAQNSAGLETLPGQTQNTLAEQRNKSADLAATADRKGLDNAAAMSKSKVAAETAKFDEDNLASTLDSMAVKNELSKQEQLDAVLGQMAKTFNANDKPRALAFANKIASASNILPEFNGKTATDIAVEKGSDKLNTGDGYRIKFTDGTDLFLTQQTMNDALTRVKGNAKLNFMHDKDTGEVLVGNESTGKVAVARPASRQNPTKDNRPSEARLVDYYISKGMPEDEAIRRANRLKDMAPANAEFQLYKDRVSLNPNADEATKQKIRQDVRKEVQDIFGGSGAALSSAPNAAPPAQASNPKIQRLISGAPNGPSLAQAPTVAQPAAAPQPAVTAAPAPAPQQTQQPAAPLSQRLAQATQADSQSGGGRNFAVLSQEVAAMAPQMQKQLQALKSALPSATGNQRQFIESKIAEIERDMPLIQSILAQASSRRGY